MSFENVKRIVWTNICRFIKFNFILFQQSRHYIFIRIYRNRIIWDKTALILKPFRFQDVCHNFWIQQLAHIFNQQFMEIIFCEYISFCVKMFVKITIRVTFCFYRWLEQFFCIQFSGVICGFYWFNVEILFIQNYFWIISNGNIMCWVTSSSR